MKRASAEICALVENAVRNAERPEAPADPEADKLSQTSLLFRVGDHDAFLKTIEKSPVFTASEPRKPGVTPPAKVLRFYWLHKEGMKRPLKNAPGILFLMRDSLVAQCTSAKRAETLRAILEKMFGTIITYRTTVHKSVEKRAEKAPSEGSPDSIEGGVIGRETALRPFDDSIDEKIAVIGNITPAGSREDAPRGKGG